MTAIAHRNDPITSHEAAAEITQSGKRQSLCSLILMYVNRHPGLVCSEYGRMLGMDRVTVARRLTDLLHEDSVRQGEPRYAGPRREVTWWPVERQGELW